MRLLKNPPLPSLVLNREVWPSLDALRVRRSAFGRNDMLVPANRMRSVRIKEAKEQRSGKMAKKRILLDGCCLVTRCFGYYSLEDCSFEGLL